MSDFIDKPKWQPTSIMLAFKEALAKSTAPKDSTSQWAMTYVTAHYVISGWNIRQDTLRYTSLPSVIYGIPVILDNELGRHIVELRTPNETITFQISVPEICE